MKKIIEELQEIADNIKYDIQQDWNDDKLRHTLQLVKIDHAIALLSSVGENNNIRTE